MWREFTSEQRQRMHPPIMEKRPLRVSCSLVCPSEGATCKDVRMNIAVCCYSHLVPHEACLTVDSREKMAMDMMTMNTPQYLYSVIRKELDPSEMAS